MATPDPRHPLVIALIKARHDAGLTQAQVAERHALVPSAIGNWEAGIRAPRIDAMTRWADTLGLHLTLAREDR